MKENDHEYTSNSNCGRLFRPTDADARRPHGYDDRVEAGEQHLTVSVIPKRMKDSENAALATPFYCTGTPEELDRELPTQVREFVAGHVALGANLAEIQHEREEAEKAAREELKKKQKTVGNGGAKGKAAEPAPKQEDKPAPAPPPMLSLFDLPAQDEAAPRPTSGQEKNDYVTRRM